MVNGVGCWGDAQRTERLKRQLSGLDANQKPHESDDSAKHSDDTCSGSRTSCSSSHEYWDDLSTAGSSSDHEADEDGEPHSPAPTGAAAVSQPPELELETQATSASASACTDNSKKTGEAASSSGLSPRVRPVVRPLDVGPPTEFDLRSSTGLLKCLQSIAKLPQPEEMSAKHLAIGELERLVDEWMLRAFPEHQHDRTMTLLFGGSWYYKVGLVDSDLDIVALLPHFVTSELFFQSLNAHLGKSIGVTKLVAMTKATVPILSFQLNGVCIDLLFARYTQDVVPKNLPIHSDHVLAGMDATSIRSLSVPRVASLILELVPDGSQFRSMLHVIRVWATRRGVYSNKGGFLGGISWTILVAFICQMFPKASLSALVHRFFTVLATWSWPAPILIAKPTGNPPENDQVAQWSPRTSHHDRAHLMPIISPGFPAVNTAVNVNLSTMRVLMDELNRGKRILDELRSKGMTGPATWHALFTPSEVMVRYDHHLVIELRAEGEEAMSEWSSFVASRTRKLVETLQHTPSISSIHPHPTMVRPTTTPAVKSGTEMVHGYYVIGFTVDTMPRANVKEVARACVAPVARYFSATELLNVPEKKSNMHAEISYRSWQELPNDIFPQGRTHAAGERARFILSKAHSMNVAMGRGR